MPTARIHTFYGKNIRPDVIELQGRVVTSLLPPNWEFSQIFDEDYASNYGDTLAASVKSNPHPVSIFLDADCIPLTDQSFHKLAWGAQAGALAGCIQRANHISNDAHLYVSPCCMAFLNEQYVAVGCPQFQATSRGDWAEELTYQWENRGQPVMFIWPSHVADPRWNLRDGAMFGIGTTFGNAFYHEGEGRFGLVEPFLAKCREVLESRRPRLEASAI